MMENLHYDNSSFTVCTIQKIFLKTQHTPQVLIHSVPTEKSVPLSIPAIV